MALFTIYTDIFNRSYFNNKLKWLFEIYLFSVFLIIYLQCIAMDDYVTI